MASRRPSRQARGGRIPAVFDRRATPRDGMHRRPNAGVVYEMGSSHRGPVAQLGARVNGIHEVTGSNPVWSTNSLLSVVRCRAIHPVGAQYSANTRLISSASSVWVRASMRRMRALIGVTSCPAIR